MPRAIRATAWSVVAAGIAAPRLRGRLRLHPATVIAVSGAAPIALCIARPRTRTRDIGTALLQMWAYLAAYEMPADDPAALERRVRIVYPVKADRALGFGVPPGLRLQRLFSSPGSFRRYEKVLVWSHWIWFMVPHGTLVYILLFHRRRFERGALHVYATFDVGAAIYWLVPTAPPWYAAERGHLEDGETPTIRRMMIEYGEEFWHERWPVLYDALAGNPVAAMPSLHFATSAMAALLLAEIGPVHGAVGWSYALTLGLALVYLGEHYVVDLVAGAALVATVRRSAGWATPSLLAASRRIQALERRARA